MEMEDYKVYCLGKFIEDTEEEAFDKYKHLMYYFRVEEYDLMVCRYGATPTTPLEHKMVSRHAGDLWLNIRPSGDYKRRYCHMSIEELRENIKWYDDKYEQFSE